MYSEKKHYVQLKALKTYFGIALVVRFIPEPSRKAKYLSRSVHHLSLLREQPPGIAIVPSQSKRSLRIQIDVLHNIVRREPSHELALALARWEVRCRYPCSSKAL